MEVEDIQIGKNLGEEIESVPVISQQNDYKVEDLDIDNNTDKAQVNKNAFAKAEK